MQGRLSPSSPFDRGHQRTRSGSEADTPDDSPAEHCVTTRTERRPTWLGKLYPGRADSIDFNAPTRFAALADLSSAGGMERKRIHGGRLSGRGRLRADR